MITLSCPSVHVMTDISHPVISTIILIRSKTSYLYFLHQALNHLIILTFSPYTGKGIPSLAHKRYTPIIIPNPNPNKRPAIVSATRLLILHTSRIRSGNTFYNTYNHYRSYLPNTSLLTVRQYIQCEGRVSIS